MNKHTWNQLSENTQNSLNEAPKKFTKRDFAKLSTEELELLSMGATMFASKGGPVISPDNITDIAPLNQIKVLAYKEKNDWILETKYNIGKKKKPEESQ